jgi:hypothetical protein
VCVGSFLTKLEGKYAVLGAGWLPVTFIMVIGYHAGGILSMPRISCVPAFHADFWQGGFARYDAIK